MHSVQLAGFAQCSKVEPGSPSLFGNTAVADRKPQYLPLR